MVQLASEGVGLPDISSLPPTHPGVLGGELIGHERERLVLRAGFCNHVRGGLSCSGNIIELG